MKITANGIDVSITKLHRERVLTGDPFTGLEDRPSVRLELDQGLSIAQLTALQGGQWTVTEDDKTVAPLSGFGEVLRHEITFVGRDSPVETDMENALRTLGLVKTSSWTDAAVAYVAKKGTL